jgi:acetyl-CoA carboxylase carboxyltransferase component
MALKRKTSDLKKRMRNALQGGGSKAIEKQKAIGKLTARERIIALLDPRSFHEYDIFVEHTAKDFDMDKKHLPGDGVVTGTGTISGHPVCIYAQDFTVAGGSLGLMHARKITKIMDHAMKLGVPIIGINDSGGARIQEGVNSLAGYGEIFYRNTQASGFIPQISVILGPCAGGAVYSPALTDYVFVVDKISKMFITGPEVIKTTIGEEISMEDLGGARVHSEITGNAHFFAESEQECFDQIKQLITFIPWNNTKKADAFPKKAPKTRSYNIETIIPTDPKQPYDVRDVIKAICDDSEFLEIQEMFAANIVIGFARLTGETVGFVANQPLVLAGVLDVDSSDKAARFIRYCDAFNIPLVTLVDLPGYLPGVDQEHAGVIRHGAKILYAYSEATVPKLTVVLRKAYGGGYIAMCSHHLRADFVFAWPTAEIAVMGPEGAANIIFRAEINSAENPEEVRKQKIKEYKEKFANPYVAAAYGYIDAVIEPVDTRRMLIHALEISENKKETPPKKKHGIPPF